MLTVALIVATVYTDGAVGAAYGAVWGGVAAATVSVGGGILINTFVLTPKASLNGTDAERTHFAFGTADKWSVLARVTGIHPRSTKVEITAVIEDSRVHQ